MGIAGNCERADLVRLVREPGSLCEQTNTPQQKFRDDLADVTYKLEIFATGFRMHLRKSEGPPPPRTLPQRFPFNSAAANMNPGLAQRKTFLEIGQVS